MNKTLISSLLVLLFGCTEYNNILHDYRLEKYNGSEIPVCVEYEQEFDVVKQGYYDVDTCGNDVYVPAQYEPVKDPCSQTKKRVVSYDYCLAQMSKPVHLVERKKDDMTICYDRNNKIELPILYCQKDMINIQVTDVNTHVTQKTNVLQKTNFNW